MPNKAQLSPAVIEAAQEAARKAKTCDELRMAQTVLVPSLINVPDQTTGQIIGRSRPTVVRLRKKFRECCAGQDSQRNWGGRRYGYLTLEQELQFLSHFFDQASEGGVLCSTTIIYSGQRQLKFPVSVNYFSRPATIRPSFLPSEVHLCF